jgi:hypothetical protein
MGPYCKFCDHRCFVPFPEKTPQAILDAYGSSSIVATCARGQAFERDKVGYCFGDILRALAQEKEVESDAAALS